MPGLLVLGRDTPLMAPPPLFKARIPYLQRPEPESGPQMLSVTTPWGADQPATDFRLQFRCAWPHSAGRSNGTSLGSCSNCCRDQFQTLIAVAQCPVEQFHFVLVTRRLRCHP